jgi:plastocyanin
LKKGETVKLTLLNQEPGKVLHCFTIGGMNVKTTRHLATGESETLTFRPREKGVFSYACLMHPMMTGKILVE